MQLYKSAVNDDDFNKYIKVNKIFGGGMPRTDMEKKIYAYIYMGWKGHKQLLLQLNLRKPENLN